MVSLLPQDLLVIQVYGGLFLGGGYGHFREYIIRVSTSPQTVFHYGWSQRMNSLVITKLHPPPRVHQSRISGFRSDEDRTTGAHYGHGSLHKVACVPPPMPPKIADTIDNYEQSDNEGILVIWQLGEFSSMIFRILNWGAWLSSSESHLFTFFDSSEAQRSLKAQAILWSGWVVYLFHLRASHMLRHCEGFRYWQCIRIFIPEIERYDKWRRSSRKETLYSNSCS